MRAFLRFAILPTILSSRLVAGTQEKITPERERQVEQFSVELKVIRRQEKTPVSDAVVRARRPGFEAAVETVETDSQGVALLLLPAGKYLITVDHDHYFQGRTAVRMPSPKTTTIKLSPGYRLGGIVQDQEGRPVDNAQILFLKAEGTAPAGESRSNAKGRFEVRLAEGAYTPVVVSPLHPAFASPETVTVGVDNPELELVIEPSKETNRLAGTVLDDSNQPIPEATIRFVMQRSDYRIHNLMRRTLRGSDLVAHETATWCHIRARFRIDRAGRFSIPLSPGRGRVIEISAMGHKSVRASLDSSQGVEHQLHLRRLQPITVQVIDHQGMPVRDVGVFGVTLDGRSVLQAGTEPGSYYIEEFPLEIFAVNLDDDRGITKPTLVTGPLSEIVVELNGRGDISGTVTDPSGVPVRRFTVRFFHRERPRNSV